MKIAGIVAEYNPFHTGHAYQIARTRELLGPDCAVAAVMSGSWVQGGRPAMLDKWTRAKLALLGGVDLVLELPTVWAASSAETFARGAVDLLALTRSVDVLSFGSECGDVEALSQIACCLNTPGYEALVRRYVFQKLPFSVLAVFHHHSAVEGKQDPVHLLFSVNGFQQCCPGSLKHFPGHDPSRLRVESQYRNKTALRHILEKIQESAQFIFHSPENLKDLVAKKPIPCAKCFHT